MARIGGIYICEDVQYMLLDHLNGRDIMSLSIVNKYYNHLCNQIAYVRLLKLGRAIHIKAKNYCKLLNIDVSCNALCYKQRHKSCENGDIESFIHIDINMITYRLVSPGNEMLLSIKHDRLDIVIYLYNKYNLSGYDNSYRRYSQIYFEHAVSDGAISITKYFIENSSFIRRTCVIDNYRLNNIKNEIIELFLINDMMTPDLINKMIRDVRDKHISMKNHLRIIKLLSKHNRISVDNVNLLLMVASKYNEKDTVEYLVNRYNINNYDNIMKICIENNNFKICNVLVLKGATYKFYYDVMAKELINKNKIIALNKLFSMENTEENIKTIIKKSHRRGLIYYLENL